MVLKDCWMLSFALFPMPACLIDFAIDRNDPPWQVWIGRFAIEQLEQELERGSSILLFPNDPAHDPVIAEHWQHSQPRRLWVSLDVLGEEDGEVEWNYYNDSRQNGVLSLGDLQSRFPNLRLLERSRLFQHRLDALMDRWIQEDPQIADLLAMEGGRLWFQGLYPVPILSGVGSWISRFAEVIWTPPVSLSIAREHAQQELNPRLDAAGFASMQELPPPSGSIQAGFVWSQDRLRRLATQVREQAEQIAALSTARDLLVRDYQQLQLHCDNCAGERDRLSGLTAELQSQLEQSSLLHESWDLRCLQLEEQDASLTGQHEALVYERDGLLVECQSLVSERDGLLQERDGLLDARQMLQAERDGLVRDRDAVAGERDGLRAERQSLVTERDGLLQERDGLLESQQTLQAERDGLVRDRDAVAGERDGLLAKRQSLEIERDGLSQERDGLLEAQQTLQAERDGLVRERDAVGGERDGLLAKRQSLEIERDALLKEREDSTSRLELFEVELRQAQQHRLQIRAEIDDILAVLIGDSDPGGSTKNNTDLLDSSKQ
jgi:uncharacterized coiled-coil DUF342 family protein